MSLNPAQLAYSSKFYDLPLIALKGDTAKSWISRGANFVVTVTTVNSGDVLCRDNLDEYVLIIPDTIGLSASIQAGENNQVVAHDSFHYPSWSE